MNLAIGYEVRSVENWRVLCCCVKCIFVGPQVVVCPRGVDKGTICQQFDPLLPGEAVPILYFPKVVLAINVVIELWANPIVSPETGSPRELLPQPRDKSYTEAFGLDVTSPDAWTHLCSNGLIQAP
jgi:hypothetical protein